jgi:hypothetical protein
MLPMNSLSSLSLSTSSVERERAMMLTIIDATPCGSFWYLHAARLQQQ